MGYLCEPDSVEQIVAAVRRLADDEPLRRNMATAGREHMVRHLDYRRMVSEYEACFAQRG